MQQQRRCSRFILGVLFLGLLTGGALTGSPAQAVDAVGPYYAEPAWDQKKAAANRFVVLTNWSSQAVLDKETGLVWERSPSTNLQVWNGARIDCTALTTGNRKGWRLPSVHELASLVDPSVAPPGPTLPAGHPFTNVQTSGSYLAATTPYGFFTDGWVVSFGDGGVFIKGGEPIESRVWCVRGSMKADQY